MTGLMPEVPLEGWTRRGMGGKGLLLEQVGYAR